MDLAAGDFEAPLRAPRLKGVLRLVIRCRHASAVCWSISIILNSGRFDGRIDCIDWEHTFIDIDGARASGFHRRIWNAKARSCERFKIPLPALQPSSAEDFIVQGLTLMGVAIKEDLPDVSKMPIR